jgi:hypothetical protein
MLWPTISITQISHPRRLNEFVEDSIVANQLHDSRNSPGQNSARGLDVFGIIEAERDLPRQEGALLPISKDHSFHRTSEGQQNHSLRNAFPDSVYEIWERQYSSNLVVGTEHVRDMKVDDFGNVYVTGYTNSGCAISDALTIKYNSMGVEQWETRFNGAASALAIDESGDVFVVGTIALGDAGDYYTIKYNSDGVEQWIAYYDGPENSGDFAAAIAVDDSGYVYVTGTSNYTNIPPASDFATIKYSPDGIELWVVLKDLDIDYARDIAVDDSGNVLVAGFSFNSDTWYDYVTIKYNASGTEKWVATYNGFGGSGNSE